MPISHVSPNFSHVYPHSHALLTVHPLSVFNRTLVTVCATVYSWVWGHSLDCGWPTRIHTLEKPGSLSQGSHQLFTAPWRGLGLRSPFMLEFWRFNLTLDVCRQPQLPWVYEYNDPIIAKRCYFLQVLPYPWLSPSFYPLLPHGTWGLWGKMWYRDSICRWPSLNSPSFD